MAEDFRNPSEEELACHEAGHVLLGKLYGRTIIKSYIDPDNMDTNPGMTLWQPETVQVICEGVNAVGGFVAQFLGTGQELPTSMPRYGSPTPTLDETQALNAAKFVASNGVCTERDAMMSFFAAAIHDLNEFQRALLAIANYLLINRSIDDPIATRLMLENGAMPGIRVTEPPGV